jgi:hypothetical protein
VCDVEPGTKKILILLKSLHDLTLFMVFNYVYLWCFIFSSETFYILSHSPRFRQCNWTFRFFLYCPIRLFLLYVCACNKRNNNTKSDVEVSHSIQNHKYVK